MKSISLAMLLASACLDGVNAQAKSSKACPPQPKGPPLGRPKNCPDPKTLPDVKGTLRDNECLIGGIMGGDFFNGCFAPDMSSAMGGMLGGFGKRKTDWSGGSGPFTAQYFTSPSLPRHTIYAPKKADASKKLPLIVWANGACGTDGAGYANFLTEIASHGFMIIASGAPSKPWGGSGKGGGGLGGEKSRAIWLTQGLDWAEKGADGGKFGQVDMTKVAAAGQSCGGVEAYSASVYEPRVKLITIWNTGVIDPQRRWMLKQIKQPIGYFHGGKSDFSYDYITKDYAQISPELPAMMSSLNVGHLGTYFEEKGGKCGVAAVAFFKWNLMGDEASKNMYFNKSSVLYKDGWSINTSHWKDSP